MWCLISTDVSELAVNLPASPDHTWHLYLSRTVAALVLHSVVADCVSPNNREHVVHIELLSVSLF